MKEMDNYITQEVKFELTEHIQRLLAEGKQQTTVRPLESTSHQTMTSY
jgi:hypothetical protein